MKSHSLSPIFLIDDNPIFLLWLKNHLQTEEKYRVHTFVTAEDALTEMLVLKPWVIISDYHFIGHMDGMEAVLKFKKISPQTKVIIISAQKDVKIPVQLIRSGADEYLEKTEACLPELLQLLERFETKKKSAHASVRDKINTYLNL